IDALDRLRESLALDELKAWLVRKRRKPYELRFRILAEQGDVVRALETAERAQARTLLDTFITAGSLGQSSEAERERQHQALARADVLRQLIPALRASRVVQPAPIAQILQGVRRRNVLMYFVEGESIWRFDVRSGRPVLEKLDLKVGDLQRGADLL